MKKVVKWVAIITAAVVLLFFLTLLIVPRFVDLDRYKPLIESKVSEATGRSFTLGGHLKLSLFPWVPRPASRKKISSP